MGSIGSNKTNCTPHDRRRSSHAPRASAKQLRYVPIVRPARTSIVRYSNAVLQSIANRSRPARASKWILTEAIALRSRLARPIRDARARSGARRRAAAARDAEPPALLCAVKQWTEPSAIVGWSVSFGRQASLELCYRSQSPHRQRARRPFCRFITSISEYSSKSQEAGNQK